MCKPRPGSLDWAEVAIFWNRSLNLGEALPQPRLE